MERLILRSGRVIEYDEKDPTYRADFLKVAGGFAEEASTLEESGDSAEAAAWWTYAAALYKESARVAPDDVTRDGHLRAAGECERQAARLAGN